MSVKLYNLSGLPDQPMRTLLTDAMRLAGATGSVVVKVTRGGARVTSYAKSAAFVYKHFLGARVCTKRGNVRRGKVATRGGYVVMQPHVRHDPLWAAVDFFETAVHEFAHVHDFQHGGRSALAWSRANSAGRRPRWAKRPEEIRAVNMTDDALARLSKQPARKAHIDEAIIELALQLEAKQARRK